MNEISELFKNSIPKYSSGEREVMTEKVTPITKNTKQKQDTQSLHPDNQLEQNNFQFTPTSVLSDENASETTKAMRRICSEVEPGRFYFRSSDKNGHSRTIRSRIPTYWENAINYVVHTMKCYKSSSDFFRDAIVHRIAWLGSNCAEIDPHELAVILCEILSNKEIIDGQAFEEMRKTVDKAMRGILKRKDYKAAQVLCKKLSHAADGMNEIYRNRIKKRLDFYRKQVQKNIELESWD